MTVSRAVCELGGTGLSWVLMADLTQDSGCYHASPGQSQACPTGVRR